MRLELLWFANTSALLLLSRILRDSDALSSTEFVSRSPWPTTPLVKKNFSASLIAFCNHDLTMKGTSKKEPLSFINVEENVVGLSL